MSSPDPPSSDDLSIGPLKSLSISPDRDTGRDQRKLDFFRQRQLDLAGIVRDIHVLPRQGSSLAHFDIAVCIQETSSRPTTSSTSTSLVAVAVI